VKKRPKLRGICYICGLRDPDSMDHVVARGFIAGPAPETLLKLAAHQNCQGRYSSSEDYVRNTLAAMEDSTSDRGAAVERAFAHFPQSRGAMARRVIRRADMPDRDQLPDDIVGAVRVDRTRFYPALEKMLRGLHYQHTGKLLLNEPSDFSWEIIDHPSKIDAKLKTIMRASKSVLVYPKIFEASYASGSGLCVWLLRFYERKTVVCIVPPSGAGLPP
jgi:hypothetical protein